MAIFNSYVSLPEGIPYLKLCVQIVPILDGTVSGWWLNIVSWDYYPQYMQK